MSRRPVSNMRIFAIDLRNASGSCGTIVFGERKKEKKTEAGGQNGRKMWNNKMGGDGERKKSNYQLGLEVVYNATGCM